MKACNSSNRWVRWMATVGCVLTLSAGAHGEGQPEAHLAAQDNSPDEYQGYVASVYAPTDIALQWQPKKAFFKDGIGDLVEAPSDVIGNEIILYQGGVNVMLELQVNDWSGPDGTTRLRAFEVTLDPNGFSNGLGGSLTEKLIPCTDDAECVAAFGGFCSVFGDACRQNDDCAQFPTETCEGSACVDWFSRLRGYCAPVYVGTKRPDFCLVHTDPVVGVDVSLPEYRFGSAGFDPAGEAFGDLDLTAKDGKAYMGTLWLEVPYNAKGSYTVGLYPFPNTLLVDQDTQYIPMVGVVPGKITVFHCADADCQPNGIPDDCEIEQGQTEDCNGNGVPDECDVRRSTSTDCNDNQTPDECDIADGTSQDCNGNDVSDDCEPDCDGSGVADDCEEDSDGDGVIDACDGCPDDPNWTSPGACGCGVLFVDSDLDTVPNCVDQCPGVDDRIDLNEDGTPDCIAPAPTLSAWGLVVLALLLLAGGKIYFGRRRAVNA